MIVIELKFLKSSRLFLSPCDGRDGSVATKQPSLFLISAGNSR